MAPVSNASLESGEPTLTLLHGFTNTSETWGSFRTQLEQAYGVEALDLPGHGRNRAIRQNLVGYGHLIAEQLADPTVLIGYSLGGRVALHCALEQPQGLRGLVLIGATAGIEDDQEREDRRQRDNQMAEGLRRSNDVKAFLERWLEGPLFSRLRDEDRHLSGRRENTVEGLASSLELMGVGTQVPLWSELHRISVPTLVLAGEDDAKFMALGHRLAEAIAHAEFCSIPGAGHAVHLEEPELTAQAIKRFAERLFG